MEDSTNTEHRPLGEHITLYCPQCDCDVAAVKIRMDVFGGPANKRVYHCWNCSSEIIEAIA